VAAHWPGRGERHVAHAWPVTYASTCRAYGSDRSRSARGGTAWPGLRAQAPALPGPMHLVARLPGHQHKGICPVQARICGPGREGRRW
jgi:hypothetical protein